MNSKELLRQPLGKLIAAAGLSLVGFATPDRAHPLQDFNVPQGGLLYSVNTTSDTVVVGACENGNPGCSLRGAIQTANSHPGADGIQFNLPAGSIISVTMAPLPDITESLGITGPGAANLTIERNDGACCLFRIFNVTTTGPVTISGLTITKGHAPSPPAEGGGIRNGTGTLTINNCVISDNAADRGGGISNASGGTVNVSNSTLTGNSAGITAGGIFNDTGSTVNVTNSNIRSNSPAGISNEGTMNVTNSAITQNSGTGIVNTETMNVTNSTISNNTASANYGGIFNDSNGTMNVTNCTISNNSTSGIAGGIRNNGISVTVKSTLIASNTGSPPDVSGGFTSAGFNLIGKNDGAVASFPAGNPNANNDIVGTSASPIDPKLDPAGLQNNGGPTPTIALQFTSPAIDKGTSNGLTGNLTTDQRGTGFPRTFDNPSVANAGNGTDVGAFESLTPVAVSRKFHGAFVFDIDLPLTGNAGIECRTGGGNGDFVVITTFPFPVTGLTSASVTSGTGSVSSASVNGSQIVANLTGVANAQTIVLTLFGVSGGTNTTDVPIPMGVLLGDTTGNGTVNASDVSQTKSKSGQAINNTNFRTDVTVSSSINASDVSLVKSKSGTALP